MKTKLQILEGIDSAINRVETLDEANTSKFATNKDADTSVGAISKADVNKIVKIIKAAEKLADGKEIDNLKFQHFKSKTRTFKALDDLAQGLYSIADAAHDLKVLGIMDK